MKSESSHFPNHSVLIHETIHPDPGLRASRLPPGWRLSKSESGANYVLTNGETFYTLHHGAAGHGDRVAVLVVKLAPGEALRTLNRATVADGLVGSWFSSVLSRDISDACLVGDPDLVDPNTAFDILKDAFDEIGPHIEAGDDSGALHVLDSIQVAVDGLKQHLKRSLHLEVKAHRRGKVEVAAHDRTARDFPEHDGGEESEP